MLIGIDFCSFHFLLALKSKKGAPETNGPNLRRLEQVECALGGRSSYFSFEQSQRVKAQTHLRAPLV